MSTVRVAVRLRPFLKDTEHSSSCVTLYDKNPKEQIVELCNNSKQPKELLRYKYHLYILLLDLIPVMVLM